MMDLQRLLITIEANEKWLQQAVRHLKLEGKDKIFTGIVPARIGQPELQLNVEICKTRLGKVYKLEVAGSFGQWYAGTRRKNFTKPIILESIDLLSQRLFLKKDVILKSDLLEYDYNPAITDALAIEIKTVSDFLLQWNYLVRFWANRVCRQSPEPIHKRIQRKAARLLCTLTFEEENELYLKKLTSGQAVSYYAFWKLPEITGCYSEYSLALKKVQTERAKRQIQFRLQKMRPVLSELNRRSEAEELNAEIEQELLNIAMYGQYND